MTDTLIVPLSTAEERMVKRQAFTLPKNYLSPSQISMYLRCPKQYYFRYVEGKISPPGVALVEGGAHHEALAFNNEHKMRTGNDLKPRVVHTRFADAFSTKKKEIEDWEGEKPDEVIERGKSMVWTYMSTVAPKLSPTLVEKEVTIKLGPLKIFGIIDVDGEFEDGFSVFDYKTAAKAKSMRDVTGSLQLSFYGWAERTFGCRRDLNVGMISLIKSGRVSVLQAPLTEGRIDWFRRVSLSVAEAISAGSFPLTMPDQWWCDQRFCGYWSQCRGKYE